MRVQEDGESEGRSVMERIRIAPSGKIILRESEPTSVGCLITRNLAIRHLGIKAEDDGSYH